MDHMESSSSTINGHTNEALEKSISAEVKKIFESSEDGAGISTDSSYLDVDMISKDQSGPNNSSDDESSQSVDVKVCDICGDAGREDFLAVCSKCKDGAEHVYCMRIQMEKLPDSSWMCEECALSEEKDKMKTVKPVLSVTYERRKTINQPNRGGEESKVSSQKIPTKINSKGLGSNLSSRGEKASPSSSADGLSGNQIPTLMRRRTEEESKIGSSSISISRDHKASYPRDTAVCGNFNKSKSFNDSDKRAKVLRLNEVPQSHISTETRGRKKFSSLSSLRKTVSFNDANSGRPTTSSPRLQSTAPKPFIDGDLKRPRITKDHESNITKLARSSRGGDDPSQNSQSLASSDASEEATKKGGTNNDSSAVKSSLSSSNAIQEYKSASQMGSSSQTENSRSTDNRQDGGNVCIGQSEEVHLGRDSDYAFYKQLATFAFPDLDCIWRGQFEIQQNDRLPRVMYGIQAHLSTLASPNVPGAVKKFSSRISLEQVSRVTAWPAQFQESQPSIALYFFAEDTASYLNYRSLLHSMVDQDLALRGNVGGIEVLIFSSSLLPEGSRHWNGMLYLWGVFRGRKVAESRLAA